MPGLSKVIVLDPDARASRQVQLGFEREGIATAAIPADALRLELSGEDAGLVVVGGAGGQGAALVRRARDCLDERGIDAPIVFAGRGVTWDEATAAGADEAVQHPAYLRDVVTIGRLLRGRPSGQRARLVGNLADLTGVFTLVRALASLGRSATLTLVRGLRRGEIRFYHGEVTSAQVGVSHGQAALHQLLLWTEARFDFHREDVVRRQQIPLSPEELFADAERFLEGVRDSSGGLSPAMVLEQDMPRVQSFARQIPTEVYGVLRMFDGHRTLADVLEDSAYRVFETLRVAQRAVEAGLLRVVENRPRRTSWRTILSIEEWLVGTEPRTAATAPGSPPGPATREPGPAARGSQSSPGKAARKKRQKQNQKQKKKKPADTPLPVARGTAAQDIDWGALVPRTVGAEVGPLAGAVPASHVSGEIVTAAASPRAPSAGGTSAGRAGGRARTEPTIVFDETAELARAAEARARAGAERAEAEARTGAGRADDDGGAPADASAAAMGSASSEPAHVVDRLPDDDTKPARRLATVKPLETDADLAPETDAGAPPVTSHEPVTPGAQGAVEDSVVADASDRITARLAALPIVDFPEAALPAAPPPASAASVATAAASAPSEVADDPSDGIVRHHIATAETAPVKRRSPPSEPVDDDRPGDTTGEITMPRARPTIEIRHSEPSILVADLAAIHAQVSAIAGEQATAAATPDAASPAQEAPAADAPARTGSEARGDAKLFSDVEEAFFRAGHEKEAVVPPPPVVDSFEDLDEDYRPVGFWERLRRKLPVPPDKPRSDKK